MWYFRVISLNFTFMRIFMNHVHAWLQTWWAFNASCWWLNNFSNKMPQNWYHFSCALRKIYWSKKGENNKKISTTKDEDKLRLKWGRKKFNKFTTRAVVRETKKDNRDNHRGSFKCKEFFIVYVWCFFLCWKFLNSSTT